LSHKKEHFLSTSSSNPGCLAAIKSIFGKLINSSANQSSSTVTEYPADKKTDVFPYRLRDDFLSPSEQSFYLILKNMMGEYLTICPKVSLADVFFVVRPNENMSAYNQINRKHVDFIICEPKTMKPRFAIELDDSTHQRVDREERDDFVDAVFKAADLPLIHIPARIAYNTTELGLLFKQVLQKGENGSENQKAPEEITDLPGAAQTSSMHQIPLCPKCGIPMVLRTAKNSQRIGQQFYGCPNFPKCREILPYK
jgi:hypothetical protein